MAKIDQDLIGKKFNRLLVLKFGKGVEQSNSHGKFWVPSWICRCDCGVEVDVQHYKLLSGHSKSCGCIRREKMSENMSTHRLSHTREYHQWLDAKRRCYNKNNNRYHRYGARGIKLSKDWQSFVNFYRDMGDCPKGMSLGRVDNDADYCKENCRWETVEQQANNRSSSKRYYYNGDILTITQISRILKIKPQSISYRINKKNMSLRKAIFEIIKTQTKGRYK